MLTNKRIGHWAWPLTAEEGLTALVVSRALRENAPVDARMKRLYGDMLKKQKKLEARKRQLSRAEREP